MDAYNAVKEFVPLYGPIELVGRTEIPANEVAALTVRAKEIRYHPLPTLSTFSFVTVPKVVIACVEVLNNTPLSCVS